MDSSSKSVAGDSSSTDDWFESWKSGFVSKAARPAMAVRMPGGANDTEVSDESQRLFLIDSHSGEPNTTIRAFDINGNLCPLYSVAMPKASLPFIAMGFTVVGSNLYMFGGRCVDEASETRFSRGREASETPFSDADTFVLDISNIPVALRSGEDFFKYIKRGPRMRRRKTLPIVYAVDETLYVLSSFVHSDRDGSFIDFESLSLADPDPSWAALPNPPFDCPGAAPRRSFHVGAHALVDDGTPDGPSIVISLTPRIRGTFIFNIKHSSWTSVSTGQSLCFTGQPFALSGSYYALSPSGSGLVPLGDDVKSAPKQELVIRGASELVRFYASHHVAAMGDVIFVFRSGSPDDDDCSRKVYLTIDRYKVSGDSIAELGDTITYLYANPASSMHSMHSLYLIPVSLGSSSRSSASK